MPVRDFQRRLKTLLLEWSEIEVAAVAAWELRDRSPKSYWRLFGGHQGADVVAAFKEEVNFGLKGYLRVLEGDLVDHREIGVHSDHVSLVEHDVNEPE